MKRIKIPYGESDYRKIRKNNCLYIDKTKYIEKLEDLNTDFPVFLRPRRFGKSLLVSTLFYYYDKNSTEEFEELFGDTYIGRNKTSLANSYYVLRFEFSGLETADEQQLREDFYSEVEASLTSFTEYYNLDIEIQRNDSYNAARLLRQFLSACEIKTGKHIYIMIDEYDHFANNIIGNADFFRSITSKDGFVRSFYEVFKAHAGAGCIDRIFITGVTSLTLDSLTSGFNIAKNVSMRRELNEMVGFTEHETRSALEMTGIEDTDTVMELLIEYYNGYLFCENPDAEKVVNSNLLLYFLDEYRVNGGIPNRMIDSNIRSDYQRLTQIFELFRDAARRTEILQSIMEGKSVEANIVTDFSFAKSLNEHEFLSILFYLGLLTIKDVGKAFDVTLEPPNAVIRDVYYKYYMEYLQIDEISKLDAVGSIGFEDDFTKFNDLITQALQIHSNDDYREFSEARLKSIFLSCLSDQKVYLIKSEYESGGRRPDIALLDIRGGRTNVKYNYLIELKYIQKSKATEAEIADKVQAARQQMRQYLNLDEFKEDARLKGIIYVVVKDEIVCFEEIEKDSE